MTTINPQAESIDMEHGRLVDSLGAQVGVLTVQALHLQIQLEEANTRNAQLKEVVERQAEEKQELMEKVINLEAQLDADPPTCESPVDLGPVQSELSIEEVTQGGKQGDDT